MIDGEKQFKSFLFDRLVYEKVSICETITLNKINIWGLTLPADEKQLVPNKSTANKMHSACEHRPELSEIRF